jgi:hypothetical protein
MSCPATTSAQEFLTGLRARWGANADSPLRPSMEQWLSYDEHLRKVHSGVYPPTVQEFMQTHFYPFAQAVLDHLTATFCAFFGLSWPRVDVNHMHLRHIFISFCEEQGLQGDIRTLEHTLHTLCDQLTAEQDDLGSILTCLDDYIAAMLRFFERNIAHSIFSHLRET